MKKPTKTIPPAFVCPLTRKVMEDPVMDQCAHTFERSAISDWLLRHECCPISRKPTSADDLRSNNILAERIDRWQWEWDNASLMRIEIMPNDELHDHDNNETDLKMAKVIKQYTSKREREQRHALYPIFMLLPQEEAALRMQRLKVDHTELVRKKENARWFVISLLMFVSILASSYFILCKLVYGDVEEDGTHGITDDTL
jgi:hypothetical protein